MKKLVLFLTVIVSTLLMTSCLGDGETVFSGKPLSYITSSESMMTYARTIDGIPITSSEIKMEDIGSFVFITYSWKESMNTITEEGIYNATVSEISDPIEQTSLVPADAPNLETELPLNSLIPQVYGDSYFDYHWIITYGYAKGDGVKKRLEFYHNLSEGTENEVIIDVRLVEDTTTDESIDKDQTSVPVAVNFRPLRDYYAETISTSGYQKTLQVCFRYYTSGTTTPQKTQLYNMIITKE